MEKPRSTLGKLLHWFGDRRAEQRAEVERLAASDDVRAVGPLIDALKTSDRQTRAIIENALIRLLPRLQASDSDLLNASQRQHLYQVLLGKNTELILAILKALEQIGEPSPMALIMHLSGGKWQTAKDTRIRSAAQEYLSIMKERLERQDSYSLTLLRAASAPGPRTDNLLRASTAPGVPLSTLRQSAEDTEEGR